MLIIPWINISVSSLQSISSEIPAHVEHCQNEQSNTIKKTEEKEEMKEKFEKLKKHWEDLQVYNIFKICVFRILLIFRMLQ